MKRIILKDLIFIILLQWVQMAYAQMNYDEQTPFDLTSAMRKVGYLKIGGNAFCNAFLISEDEVITNAHCIDSQEICDKTELYFEDMDGLSVIYPCERLIAKGDQEQIEQDVARLKFSGRPGFYQGYFHSADENIFNEDWASMGQFVWIVKIDPPTLVKSQSNYNLTKCKTFKSDEYPDNLVFADVTDYLEPCHLQRGNSGSPILNSQGHVIGLISVAKVDLDKSIKFLNINKNEFSVGLTLMQIISKVENLKK